MFKVVILALGLLAGPDLPQQPSSYEQALGHLADEDDERAYEAVEQATRRGETDPKVYLLKGSMERERGDLKTAAQTFAQGLEAAPRHADLSLELGITLWWLGQHEKALVHLETVVSREPGRAPGWETKGRILLSLDRRTEAEESLRRAIALDPRAAGPHAALGTVYRSRADKKRARAAYEKALQLDPDNGEAKEGIEALGQLHLWTLEANARAIVTAGQMVRPGGEIMLRRKWSASTFSHVRATHEVRTWRNQVSVGFPTETDVMSRGELGVLFEPARNLKLLPAYAVTHSNLPLHQALSLEGSYLLHKTVLLASVRPGLDTEGQKDVASQLGVQQIFGESGWAMLQVFDYRNDLQQNSVTGVLTASVNPGKLRLKVGGGIGKYPAGPGYPAFGSLGYAFSHALTVRAEYNYFGGFFTQHQFGLSWVWGF